MLILSLQEFSRNHSSSSEHLNLVQDFPSGLVLKTLTNLVGKKGAFNRGLIHYLNTGTLLPIAQKNLNQRKNQDRWIGIRLHLERKWKKLKMKTLQLQTFILVKIKKNLRKMKKILKSLTKILNFKKKKCNSLALLNKKTKKLQNFWFLPDTGTWISWAEFLFSKG